MPSSAEYNPIKATQVRIAAERFYVLLEDGRELGIPYDWYWRLAEATPEELNNWRLIAGGQGISWEDLDEDLSVLGLLEGRRSKIQSLDSIPRIVFRVGKDLELV